MLMRLLISNIEELEKQYPDCNEESAAYDDELLNLYHHHCKFLSDYQEQIVNDTGIPLKEILYSLYYWGHQFIERANAVPLSDAGFEDWHFQLIEQIESCCGEVDCALLEQIDRNQV